MSGLYQRVGASHPLGKTGNRKKAQLHQTYVDGQYKFESRGLGLMNSHTLDLYISLNSGQRPRSDPGGLKDVQPIHP